jgi:hypothetical protein
MSLHIFTEQIMTIRGAVEKTLCLCMLKQPTTAHWVSFIYFGHVAADCIIKFELEMFGQCSVRVIYNV